MEDPQEATVKRVRLTTAERRRATLALGLSRMEDPQEATIRRVRPTTAARRRVTSEGRIAGLVARLWRAVLSYLVVLGFLATSLDGDVATEASPAIETVPAERSPANEANELTPPVPVELSPANEASELTPPVPVELSSTNEAVDVMPRPTQDTSHELKKVTEKAWPSLPPPQVVIQPTRL
jgi:hypothetical protein